MSQGTRLFALLAAGCLVGCGENAKPQGPAVYPAQGELRIDGLPAVGAMLKFYREGQMGRMPTAVVREDGRYAVSYRGTEEGLPAGTYQVLVVWMVPPPEGGLPTNRLQGRFSDPRNPVKVVTIMEGDNQIEPILLKTQR